MFKLLLAITHSTHISNVKNGLDTCVSRTLTGVNVTIVQGAPHSCYGSVSISVAWKDRVQMRRQAFNDVFRWLIFFSVCVCV